MNKCNFVGDYLVVWHWTEAWRCMCISSVVTNPKLLTDDPLWMRGRTVVGTYDIRKPLDMFRLGGVVNGNVAMSYWQEVSRLLESKSGSAMPQGTTM